MGRKTKDRQSVRRNVGRRDLVDRISEPEHVGKLHLLPGQRQQDGAPLAPAYYAGRQKGTDNVADFDLYILTAEIPGYVQWSTVSGRTLEAAGFRLPPCVPNQDHEHALAQIRRLWQGSRHDELEERRPRGFHITVTSDHSPIVFPVIRKR